MIVYRFSQKKYAKDLSGKGAELYGGRWNNIGMATVYTAESRSLCLVEIAVHTPFGIHPKNYCLITIEIPDSDVTNFPINQLPKNWDSVPHSSSSQQIGDLFLKTNDTLALRVPSAIVKDEFNILINPHHQNFKKVTIQKIESFDLDSRLFKK